MVGEQGNWVLMSKKAKRKKTLKNTITLFSDFLLNIHYDMAIFEIYF